MNIDEMRKGVEEFIEKIEVPENYKPYAIVYILGVYITGKEDFIEESKKKIKSDLMDYLKDY